MRIDSTERVSLEAAAAIPATKRTEQLLTITKAIADATTTEHVVTAVIERVADALETSTAAIWLLDHEASCLQLARARGYADAVVDRLRTLPTDRPGLMPATDVARTGNPVWIHSQSELLAVYPHLTSVTTKGRNYKVACLPIFTHGRMAGSVGLTFECETVLDAEQQAFLMLVARSCGQALERVRLFEAEHASRLQAEAACASTEQLHQLAARVIAAPDSSAVYEAALDTISHALGTQRAAVLLYDAQQVMRFVASRGLSETYRAAVEGHSPWQSDVSDPAPVVVEDVRSVPELSSYLPLFESEGIRSLGFFPLVDRGRLVGKFMVYYPEVFRVDPRMRDMAMAIANHVAAGAARFTAMQQVREHANRLEQVAFRLGQLQSATSKLATAMTMSEVADVVISICESTLGASAGVFYLLDGEHLRLAGWRGVPAPTEHWQVLSLDSSTAVAAAVRQRAPVWIDRCDRLVEELPTVGDSRNSASSGLAVAALPLLHGDRIVGVLATSFTDAARLDGDARQWLEMFAVQCAHAVERARSFESEQTARAEAETLYRIADVITSSQLDLDALVQRVTDEATSLVGARFGALFYNLIDQQGESYVLYTLSGAPREAFAKFGLPRNTPVFAPTFRGEGVVRLDDVTADPRYGTMSPHHGMPRGHLPVKSYLAVPVMSRSGEVLGGLFFGHPEPGKFTVQHERMVKAIAASAAVAVDNARLFRMTVEAKEIQVRRALHAELGAEIGAAFTEGGSLRSVLRRCCGLLVERLDVAFARVWTVAADGRTLELQASAGLYTHLDGRHARVPIGSFKIGLIAEEREPHLSNDVLNDPRLSDPEWAKREGMIAFAGYPLVVEDTLVGVMGMFARRQLPAETLEALASFARTMTIGIGRLRVESERERLVGELAQTVRFNEMFAGMLGHDLRNPLGSMMTGAQLVMTRTQDERIVAPLARVLSSGHRMARMVDQLLDFTRARVGGGLAIHPREMDLRVLAGQAIEEVELANPTWSFEIDITGEVCGEWDADRLAQVFSNLVGNGVQHGDARAPLRIKLDGSRADHVRVDVSNAGTIPAELVPKLFDPFRGTQHKRNGSQGLGLGLYITQQLVRAHGGEIHVTSSAEANTTFTIHLPRAGARPQREDP
ncbi:MAG: GAF domain-containing protein [Deltaproteobacteria bacterium]|nr:GAF domain-containing protein [Deltaproteobacteria bacterium]